MIPRPGPKYGAFRLSPIIGGNKVGADQDSP
ncbi:Uncharacterised protein [Streptococcus pneumoniae]|nr:Uncharacterised protein [Streptococcus pneumoniae]CKF99122.1 Uncharacterised protein [Streptococcus pneumoniae]